MARFVVVQACRQFRRAIARMLVHESRPGWQNEELPGQAHERTSGTGNVARRYRFPSRSRRSVGNGHRKGVFDALQHYTHWRLRASRDGTCKAWIGRRAGSTLVPIGLR